MDFESLAFSFAERQLDGIYDARGYRRYIAEYANKPVDVKVVTAFGEADTNNIVTMKPGARDAIMAFDAHFFMALLANEFMGNPLDTTNPVQWFELIDALCCANRLTLFSGLRFDGFATATDAIWMASIVTELMARLSSRAYRDTAPVLENAGAMYRKRAISIFCDIVCGRGGLWVEFAYDMAREACAVGGVSFDEVYDTYARNRFNVMQSFVSSILEDGEDALSFIIGAVTFATTSYDALQTSLFNLAFDEGGAEVSEDALAEAIDEDVYRRVMQYLPEHEVDADVLSGYMREFGIEPLRMIFVLPEDMMFECAMAYEVSKTLG